MNSTATKTKLVFLPLVFLATAFIVGYCSLYWLLYLKLEIVHLKKDIIEFWIPIGLAFILLLLLIRPRLHLLKLEKDNGKIRGLYYMVAAAILCVPTMIGIGYIDSATGKLTEMFIVTDLPKKPATKYYKPDTYVLRKDLIGVQPVSSYSGKRNQYLNFDIYIAVPFIGELYDTLNSPPAFLSVKYHKQISSKIKDDAREREWDDFWRESFDRFNKEDILFEYLERYDNTDEKDRLINAAKKSPLYKEGASVVVLQPIEEPFSERNDGKLKNFFLCLGIGFLVWFVMIIIPGLHRNKVKKFNGTDKKEISREINDAYQFIKPKPGFAATPTIAAINILIFLIMVFAGLGIMDFYTPDLIRLGALYEPLVDGGEWWRLCTSMFLHGGLIHLVMNMISLVLSGVFLEPFIGTKRFVAGYLISGIVAALISMWWHDKPLVAVGASGAIFGLYGMILSLIVSKIFDPAMNKMLLVLLACTAGYSLLMGFMSEGIDNSAHVGGLLAGFAIGLFYAKKMKAETDSSDLHSAVKKRDKSFIEQD